MFKKIVDSKVYYLIALAIAAVLAWCFGWGLAGVLNG